MPERYKGTPIAISEKGRTISYIVRTILQIELKQCLACAETVNVMREALKRRLQEGEIVEAGPLTFDDVGRVMIGFGDESPHVDRPPPPVTALISWPPLWAEVRDSLTEIRRDLAKRRCQAARNGQWRGWVRLARKGIALEICIWRCRLGDWLFSGQCNRLEEFLR